MESKTENRKWKNAGRFPAELLFMTGFFAGNVLPNLIWKMEWKQKTLASFLSDPQLCRKKIFPAELISWKCCDEEEVFFLLLFFMRIYNIRSAF